jgi:hypothetical protein
VEQVSLSSLLKQFGFEKTLGAEALRVYRYVNIATT